MNIETGGGKGDKRFTVVKKSKELKAGSAQSIYATAHTPNISQSANEGLGLSETSASRYAVHPENDLEEADQDGWIGGTNTQASTNRLKIVVGSKKHLEAAQSSETSASAVAPSLRKSRSGLSLSERLGMDALRETSKGEPMPNIGLEDSGEASTRSQKDGKRSKPATLDLAGQVRSPLLISLPSPVAQTPLSATHPPPETPLKHMFRGQKKRADLLATPNTEMAVHNATLSPGTSRMGGLLLDAGEGTPVLPRELQTPKRDFFPLAMSSGVADDPAQLQIDQMLAKVRLARSEAGTQESRWAVKEPEKASMSVQDEVIRPAPPTAPRALREVKPLQMQSTPRKSLLERLGPAATESEEAVKPSKGKKDRKRGGKKHEERHEEMTHDDLLAAPESEGQDSVLFKPINEVPPSPEGSPLAVQDHSEDQLPSLDSHLISDDIEAPPSLLPPSSSSTSIFSSLTTGGSTVGNDTFTSINWADDDDELPELPEEWMRASQAGAEEVNETSLPSDSLSPSVESKSAEVASSMQNGNAKRGGRRGGRGRGNREKEERHDNAVPSRAPRGLRIAGSASSTSRAATKELFPLHKSAQHHSQGPATERQTPREQKPHGRPKLVTSNKDAFSRLTKGALNNQPSTPAGPGHGAATSRIPRQSNGAVGGAQ